MLVAEDGTSFCDVLSEGVCNVTVRHSRHVPPGCAEKSSQSHEKMLDLCLNGSPIRTWLLHASGLLWLQLPAAVTSAQVRPA